MRLYLSQFYAELIQSRVNWNTLTLVLHGYVILSLVEVEFYEDPRGTARGTSRGTCRGLRVDCCR